MVFVGIIFYVSKMVFKFFGGNKCKLFLVIVFLGNFLVFIFDEFSFVMDVLLKCVFWKIFEVVVLGCFVFIIIYSMEEVDVLFICVVIFVKCMFVIGIVWEL